MTVEKKICKSTDIDGCTSLEHRTVCQHCCQTPDVIRNKRTTVNGTTRESTESTKWRLTTRNTIVFVSVACKGDNLTTNPSGDTREEARTKAFHITSTKKAHLSVTPNYTCHAEFVWPSVDDKGSV